MVLANDDVNRELARRAERVLASQAPRLSPARRALVATMVIETVSAMLILSARRGDAFGEAVVLETKTMLRRYLEPIVTEHAHDHRDTDRTRGHAKGHAKGQAPQKTSARARKR
jgi:hypothetical protein